VFWPHGCRKDHGRSFEEDRTHEAIYHIVRIGSWLFGAGGQRARDEDEDGDKNLGRLTHRERQVMGLVVSGHLNKQVGAELGISEITVKAHRSKMTRKMKARTVADLVHMADKLRIAPARRADAQRPGSNSSKGEGSSGSCDTGTGAVARGTAAHAHGGHPAIAGSRRPAGEIRTDRYGG
jgi:DNA-binding CsgD family transcriptional regulator